MTNAPELLTGCSICGEAEADPRNLQSCFECGNPFHLNPRNDQPGLDCGDAWIGESLGVEYFCQRCIDVLQAEAMAGQGGDPARARHAAMLQTIAPGGGPESPSLQPGPTAPAPREAPLKAERARVRRRYRRIDR